MSRGVDYITAFPWAGGLNTAQDPIVLDFQKLQVCDNVVFTDSGSRVKRGGQAHVNSSPITTAAQSVIWGTDYWADVASTKKQAYVVALSNGDFYWSRTGSTWIKRNTLALTVTQGELTSTTLNQDLIIGYSKTAAPRRWIGQSTAALAVFAPISTLAIGNIVQTHKNRVMVAGNAARKDRLYYSAPFSSTDFTTSASGFIDLYPGDGDPDGITAIFPEINQGGLYVAKRNRLYFVDTSSLTPASWSIKQVSDNVGCVNHNTAKAVDQQDVFFMSDRGIHSLGQVLSGTAVIEGAYLSAEIHPDFQNVWTQTAKQQCSAVWHGTLNSYMVTCRRQGKATFETTYGYNVILQQWYRWTETPCNFLFTRFNGDTKLWELKATAPGGYVNSLNTSNYNDFGSAIAMRLKTAALFPGSNKGTEKQFTSLVFYFRSKGTYPFNVSYNIDDVFQGTGTVQQRTNGSNLLGTTLLGPAFVLGLSSVRMKPYYLDISGVGNSIEVTIEQSGVNQSLELFGMGVGFKEASTSQNPYRSIS